jgi:hypothetical protein
LVVAPQDEQRNWADALAMGQPAGGTVATGTVTRAR